MYSTWLMHCMKTARAFKASCNAIPTIRLRFNGEVIPLHPQPDMPSLAADDPENAEALDREDLRDRVDKEFERDATDAEDGPDWMFEDGETRSSDPEYVFCPAPHRKQLLHLFTKHFCQHPLFPEPNIAPEDHTSESIRRNAVFEMYTFCRQRGLTEVWGYLWTSWYSPKRWSLWARSTSERISRLRTTMTVEKFWQQLKGDFLKHLRRPRLDQLVYILIYRVTPGYLARAEMLEDTRRLGRSRPLTTYQQYFKAAWKKLQEAAVSGTEYETNITEWTCNCGAQKYHPHHLCKHLVQAVQDPLPIKFWRDVYRRRTAPLYRHPDIKAKDDSSIGGYCDADDGAITDGDDHVWLGNREQLKTYAGWEPLEGRLATQRKRPRMATRTLKSTDAHNRSSSPIPYATKDSEDEADEVRVLTTITGVEADCHLTHQLKRKTEKLQRRAAELRAFADIIDSQIPFGNSIWISSMVDRNIGGDVSLALQDIRHVEETGRRRETTWGRKGDRVGQRRVRNTMGYQVRDTAVASGSRTAAASRSLSPSESQASSGA